MFDWLIQQVNWLLTNVNKAISKISDIIDNPIGTLWSLVSYVFNAARSTAEAIGENVRRALDYAINNINAWIHIADDLIWRELPRKIQEIRDKLSAVGYDIGEQIGGVIRTYLVDVWDWIHHLDRWLHDIGRQIGEAVSPVYSWARGEIEYYYNRLQQRIDNIKPPDLSEIFRDISNLKTVVTNLEGNILYKVYDGFLDWLGDKIGEALE